MSVIHKAEQPETTPEIKQPEREAKTEPKQPEAITDAMKLFVKMAKHIGKKSVIPVCDYIFFQNGKATATDIENIIQINSNERCSILHLLGRPENAFGATGGLRSLGRILDIYLDVECDASIVLFFRGRYSMERNVHVFSDTGWYSISHALSGARGFPRLLPAIA